MKIFLSWSGEISKKVALAFRDWLPNVIQNVDPYVSSEDIDKGARWSSDLAHELEKTDFGIIFLTSDNLSKPWINFEAGALAKMIDNSKVSSFLLDMKPSEIHGPLVQFQNTIFNKEDIIKLLKSINNQNGGSGISESRLEVTFNKWWSDLENELIGIRDLSNKNNIEIVTGEKDEEDNELSNSVILEEILELTRNQYKLLKAPKNLIPASYIRGVMNNSNSNFAKGEMRFILRDVERMSDLLEDMNNKFEFVSSGTNATDSFYNDLLTLRTIARNLKGDLYSLNDENQKNNKRLRLNHNSWGESSDEL